MSRKKTLILYGLIATLVVVIVLAYGELMVKDVNRTHAPGGTLTAPDNGLRGDTKQHE